MMELESKHIKVVVDDEGFLEESEAWNESVARVIAKHEGVQRLDSEKMKIVSFMRQYYEKHHNFPILGNVCRKIGSRSRDCVTREFIDPMKAWKIAGLPKPPNIFFTSFDNKRFTPNPFY